MAIQKIQIIHNSLRNYKVSGINFTRNTQYLNKEAFKILILAIDSDLNKWRRFSVLFVWVA